MSGRTRIVIGSIVTLALAVGAGAATAGYTVANDKEWTAAADRRIVREDDRDAIRTEVAEQEQHLHDAAASIGVDPTPVHDEPVEYPSGTDESVLGGDSVIGDFTDVYVDEGIVLQGVSVEEVENLPLRPIDTIPPKPQPPVTAKDGSRLLKVTLRVTNRSGDGADPACGIANSLTTYAYMDNGDRAQIADVFGAIGTYPFSCGDGLADGTSGDIVMGVGLQEDRKLTALQFTFLGDDSKSDSLAPLLVLDEPA